MRIAQVILDIPTQALDQAFSYLIPDDMEQAQVGCSVLVPFGGRKAVGFVMSIKTYSSLEILRDAGLNPERLKSIEEVLSKSYFDEDASACVYFLARRYVAPLSSCVRLFTPPGGVPTVVKSKGVWRVKRPAVGEVDDRWVMLGSKAEAFTPRKGAVKQEAILKALRMGALRVSELAAEYGNISSSLKSLEKRGVVRVERRRRFRPAFEGQRANVAAASGAGEGAGVGVSEVGSVSGLAGTSEADGVSETGSAGAGTSEAGGAGETGSVGVDAGASTSAGVVEYAHTPFKASAKPQLTAGQVEALAEISRARSFRDGHVVVLDGVTGSGKTEVYLQAIEEVLLEGRTAIVLVPEISLTPQTVARFRGRFGDLVAVLHSRMSQGERYDQWDFIRSGSARVVVGARSALFAPLSDVGLIIIDEEHETSYKQDQAPRYVSRDVAEWKVQRAGAALVLGSATPSIEALSKVDTCDRWSCVRLPERANGKPMPEIQVVDMAREFGGGNRSMFSFALRKAMEEALRAGRKVVLLLNQRGFASFVLCRNCGFVPECPNCSTSLTYHERGNLLMCHHCDHREPTPPICPVCQSPYLRKFGAGTQRVEAELLSYLESLGDVDARVIRMDADTTATKGAHQRLLEEFAAADSAVLLGTQMIAKGLDFDDVVLVGVINADTQLRLPDFRSGERTFDLIEQVAGRAGRAELDGRVIVQTYNANAVPIQAAAHYNRQMLLDDELSKRKLLSYPPFVRLADVLLWGPNEEEVAAEGRALSEAISRALAELACNDWILLPATPCVISRTRGNWRYHITIKTPLDADIAAVLQPLFRARKSHENVNVAVDIDPVSML